MPIVDGEVIDSADRPDLDRKLIIKHIALTIVVTAVVAVGAFALAKKFPSLAA